MYMLYFSLSLSLSIPEETTCSTKAVLGSYIQKIFAKLATSNYSPHIRYIASIITSGDTACEISILALRFTWFVPNLCVYFLSDLDEPDNSANSRCGKFVEAHYKQLSKNSSLMRSQVVVIHTPSRALHKALMEVSGRDVHLSSPPPVS